MTGNTIIFKDVNLNDCKGRILDKVLVEEDSYTCNDREHKTIVINKYLVITNEKIITLVEPNQIKSIL